MSLKPETTNTVTLKNSSGGKLRAEVTLNPHLLRKMEQAQANMMRCVHRRWRPRRRMLYWSRQFQKWSNLLIERASVIEFLPCESGPQAGEPTRSEEQETQ